MRLSPDSPSIQTTFGRVSDSLQTGLLIGLGGTLPTSFRWIIWELPIAEPLVYAEFRAVVLFLPDAAAILLALVTLVRLMRTGPTAVVRLFLLPTWVLLGLLWAVIPVLTAYHALHLTLCGLAAVAVTQITDIRPLLVGLAIVAAVHGAIATAQVINGGTLGLTMLGEIPWDPSDPVWLGETTFRGYGLTIHPNNLAGYLIAGLAWCGVLIRTAQTRPWGLLCALPTALGLFATVSRAALAAAIVALFIYLIVQRKFSWQ
ncbi:MAG: hypothetical protein GYB64_18655, partial [Chloroflexi bacterium]|nr:hypothetical protein [Chloroflexota bacterium]